MNRYLAFPEGHEMYQTTLQKQAFVEERISTEFAEPLRPARIFGRRYIAAPPRRMIAKIKLITARTSSTWIHQPKVAPLTMPKIQSTNKMTVIVHNIARPPV